MEPVAKSDSVEKFEAEHAQGHNRELLDRDVRASAEKKLVRRLDSRLLPTVIAIYLMNYIDVRFMLLRLSSSLSLTTRSVPRLLRHD